MIRVRVKANSAIAQAGLEMMFRSSPAFELTGEDEGPEFAADLVVAGVESQADAALRELLDWAAEGGSVVLLVDGPVGEWGRDLLRAGVKAILPNRIGEPELLAAAEAAAAGLITLHPDDVETLVPRGAAGSDATLAALVDPLTAREIEVLRLLAEGSGNKAIAARLNISEHTVKFHIASILGKLGAATRTEAVTLGIRRGLILI